MPRNQRKYSDEFKKTIIELYNTGKSLSVLSSEYGISKSTISDWIKNSKPVVVNNGEVVTLKEYKALKQEIALLKEENEILKKAMAMRDGWCYLASVMDLHSRKIIGYAFDKVMDTDLAIRAVKNAYECQKPSKQIILHSDLGSQYTSSKFAEYISEIKFIHSFSSKGNPYDNACIESFHAALKKEEVNLVTYYDFNAARLAIFEYIESWYNRKRIHSSIGYITPQQCEDMAEKSA